MILCLVLFLSILHSGESFRRLFSPKVNTFVESSKKIGSILIASGITFFGAPLAYDSLFGASSSNQAASHFVAFAAETSVFDGLYNDPNHPGCLRKITSKVKIFKTFIFSFKF